MEYYYGTVVYLKLIMQKQIRKSYGDGFITVTVDDFLT